RRSPFSCARPCTATRSASVRDMFLTYRSRSAAVPLGGAAHRQEVAFVDHGTVESNPVDLVGVGGVTDFRDDNLDFPGLAALREDRAEGLGVRVGQHLACDV